LYFLLTFGEEITFGQEKKLKLHEVNYLTLNLKLSLQK
jgi:hypothetical protein